VYLLFSFEFCCVAAAVAGTSASANTSACYFLLNFVDSNYGTGWWVSNDIGLLFSFEFCLHRQVALLNASLQLAIFF